MSTETAGLPEAAVPLELSVMKGFKRALLFSLGTEFIDKEFASEF